MQRNLNSGQCICAYASASSQLAWALGVGRLRPIDVSLTYIGYLVVNSAVGVQLTWSLYGEARVAVLPISARLSLTLSVGAGLPCLQYPAGHVEPMGTRVCAIDSGAKLRRDANWSLEVWATATHGIDTSPK